MAAASSETVGELFSQPPILAQIELMESTALILIVKMLGLLECVGAVKGIVGSLRRGSGGLLVLGAHFVRKTSNHCVVVTNF